MISHGKVPNYLQDLRSPLVGDDSQCQLRIYTNVLTSDL